MLKPVDDYHTMTCPGFGPELSVASMCSEEVLAKHPYIRDSFDTAVSSIACVLAARKTPWRVSSQMHTWSSQFSEVSLAPELPVYDASPLLVRSENCAIESLNVGPATIIPYLLNLTMENSKIGVVITDRPLIDQNGSSLYGGAANGSAIASVSFLTETLNKHLVAISNAHKKACHQKGKDSATYQYMLDEDYILREGFARLLTHELGHCVGLPLPSGTNTFDTALYVDSIGIHCRSANDNGRTCIMNQALNADEWFEQFFSEKLTGIRFCSLCSCSDNTFSL